MTTGIQSKTAIEIALLIIILVYEIQLLPILQKYAKNVKTTTGVISITFGIFIAKKSLMKNSQPR